MSYCLLLLQSTSLENDILEIRKTSTTTYASFDTRSIMDEVRHLFPLQVKFFTSSGA